MSSLVSEAAKTAHSVVASALFSRAQIQPGQSIPAQKIKEDSAEQASDFVLKGKNIIVGVPGAFTGTCSAQVPGYIEKYEEFKAKGINNIYIVAVNDVFVTKAWKENLASGGTPVHFLADDTGSFVSSIGCLFDATPLLGSPRSKRYVIVANDDKVESITVEADPGKLTITDAKTILASLS